VVSINQSVLFGTGLHTQDCSTFDCSLLDRHAVSLVLAAADKDGARGGGGSVVSGVTGARRSVVSMTTTTTSPPRAATVLPPSVPGYGHV
jgi:hypothetical protein